MKCAEIFRAMVDCLKKIELIFLSQVSFIFSFVVGYGNVQGFSKLADARRKVLATFRIRVGYF